MRHILEKSRKNREDEADADGVEADGGEDDDKGSVHNGGSLQPTTSTSLPRTCPRSLTRCASEICVEWVGSLDGKPKAPGFDERAYFGQRVKGVA